MKIAILTSGRLPVPAVQGGAVENLVDYYLDYNERVTHHEISVYSIKPNHPIPQKSTYNHYYYIDTASLWGKFKKFIFKLTHKNGFYDSSISYYLQQSINSIKKHQYDAIILENRPGYSIELSKVTNSPIYLHLHNDMISENTQKIIEVRKHISKVLTVSDFIKRRVESIPDGLPVQTIYNGIDIDRFSKATPCSRNTFGIKDNDFVFVFSGRLTTEKGIKELIMAFVSIAPLFPTFKLLIIGGNFYGSSQNDDPFIESLKEISEPLSERIIFTGFQSYDKIPGILKMSDVAIIPSVWDDPYPTTVIEAMASKMPIIATISGGIPEMCNNAAILLERNDKLVTNLANAMVDLFRDKQKRTELANIAYQKSTSLGKDDYSRRFFTSLSV
ncbi:MAG: glycosyltransferase family 4 protein [Bacteroidaceae bacterium]|nr:glycosyltransferase family 4 protein [Bacteroidaceae bacterium]MDO4955429.1 glycosyltransferase family 4 protein [Bacteroidales bacterium]